jgi:hypothetical protein
VSGHYARLTTPRGTRWKACPQLLQSPMLSKGRRLAAPVHRDDVASSGDEDRVCFRKLGEPGIPCPRRPPPSLLRRCLVPRVASANAHVQRLEGWAALLIRWSEEGRSRHVRPFQPRLRLAPWRRRRASRARRMWLFERLRNRCRGCAIDLPAMAVRHLGGHDRWRCVDHGPATGPRGLGARGVCVRVRQRHSNRGAQALRAMNGST